MRTTITLDDDVLSAAKEMAVQENKTIGEVISTLARKGLRPERPAPKKRNGIPLLTVRKDASPVTSEMVHRLREDLP